MSRDRRILALCTFIVAGLALAVRFHYVQGYYEGRGYPANTFLYRPEDAGGDFFHIFWPVKIGQPYGSRVSVYFPFTYVPLFILTWMPAHMAFLAVVASFTAVLGALMWWTTAGLSTPQRRLTTIVLTIMTYPYLFCVDRGNVEMLVLMFLTGFVFVLLRQRYAASAILLGCAAAMKGYPAMFALVFAAGRKWAAVFIAAAVAIVLTVVSAAAYPGGLALTWTRLSANLVRFTHDYITSTSIEGHFNANGMRQSASLFALGRVLELTGTLSPHFVGWFERAYVGIAMLLGAIATGWILFFEKTLWRQMMIVTIAILLLPQVSFDYKLVLLMLPIALYLRHEPEGRYDRPLILTLGLLLVPKAYLWIRDDISVSTILTPLLLVTLAALVVADGVTSRAAAGSSSSHT
jgi:hypothetical protein